MAAILDSEHQLAKSRLKDFGFDQQIVWDSSAHHLVPTKITIRYAAYQIKKKLRWFFPFYQLFQEM